MKKILVLYLFLMCLSLWGQGFDKSSLNFSPTFSLLNPNQMQMNHAVAFMSGMSSNGGGYYQSVYANMVQFKLRENLNFNVELDFVNYGTMSHNNDMNFSSNRDNQNAVVPSFSLEYKPFTNTTIHFEYRQINGLYNSFTPYGNTMYPHRRW